MEEDRTTNYSIEDNFIKYCIGRENTAKLHISQIKPVSFLKGSTEMHIMNKKLIINTYYLYNKHKIISGFQIILN